MGAAAGYDEVQVWKDVDGILSADPRICEAAIPVPRVSYNEAAELAYFGAKVLHPVAMQPAVRANTPVRVKNSYNPEAEGTLITGDYTQKGLVSAITSKSDIAVVDITSTRMLGAYGFLSKVSGQREPDEDEAQLSLMKPNAADRVMAPWGFSDVAFRILARNTRTLTLNTPTLTSPSPSALSPQLSALTLSPHPHPHPHPHPPLPPPPPPHLPPPPPPSTSGLRVLLTQQAQCGRRRHLGGQRLPHPQQEP